MKTKYICFECGGVALDLEDYPEEDRASMSKTLDYVDEHHGGIMCDDCLTNMMTTYVDDGT